MKILMTGHLGFVGAATKRLLEDRGHYVDGFDVMEGMDIRKINRLRAALNRTESYRFDRILHLAAIARFADADRDPLLAFETNVVGTRNVARVAAENRIPLIYASTGSVYMPIGGTPPITEDFRACGNSVYGCTKYAGELYVRRADVPWIVLRYAHLYGAEKRMHGLIGGFLDRIKRGAAPTLYGGQQSNDFIYVRDVAEANVLALEAPWDKWRQAYNIGTGVELTAEDAGRAVCDVFGYDGPIEQKDQRSVDPGRFVFDIEKARAMLGFEPQYGFRDGLEDMKDEMDPARVKLRAMMASHNS